MNNNTCTKEMFLEQIKDHKMYILKDDDLYRHIRFKRDSMNMFFDLVTWKGHLVICGDMGDFHFSRIDDMFEFFHNGEKEFSNEHIINRGYWSEKLQGKIKYEKYDSDKFEESVKLYYDEWIEANDVSDYRKRKIWSEIESSVLNEEYSNEMSEFDSMRKVFEFEDGDFSFSDFHPSCKVYTYHYTWCCYAIVWGIIEYKKLGVNK